MGRLTADEREIKSSRGIPIWRFWPFAVMALVSLILNTDGNLFQRCVGDPLYGRDRVHSFLRMILGVPCEIYTFRGGSLFEHLSVAMFFASIPFCVMHILWMRRHKTYWDGIRAREKLKRAEKRAAVVDSERKTAE